MVTRSSKVGSNVHVRLAFDDSESLASGVPRNMGFRLVVRDGFPRWSSHNDAPRVLIDQVRANGFQIDPETLEIIFEKNDWSGSFGAYIEKPTQNRPAFTINADHRNKNVILGPRLHNCQCYMVEGADPQISGYTEFVHKHYVCRIDRYIYRMDNWEYGAPYFTPVFYHSNSAALLRDLRVYDGSLIAGAGSTAAYAYLEDGTNILEGLNESFETGNPPTGWTLTGAGATVARSTTQVKHGTYSVKLTRAGADCSIYKDLANPTSYQGLSLTVGVWVYCSAANRTRVRITDDVGNTWGANTFINKWEYIRATRVIDAAATYVRISVEVIDNASLSAYFDHIWLNKSWVESSRGGNDDYIEQGLANNGMFHKTRMPCYHSQVVNPKAGGDAWSSEDKIDDSSHSIQMMVALGDNVIFPKNNGIFYFDPDVGIFKPLYPELQTLTDDGNGWHAHVWHNELFYPTFRGELTKLSDEGILQIAPARYQQRWLELDPMRLAVFNGRIRAMASTQDYLYAELLNEFDSLNAFHRILACEKLGRGVYIWHSLIDLDQSTSDELWITSDSTDGPVLWAHGGGASVGANPYFQAAYWILASGIDPVQDPRYEFVESGTLYDPWLDMGCPSTKKRWELLEIESYRHGTTASIGIDAKGSDGEVAINKTLTLAAGLNQNDVQFTKGFYSKRMRLAYTLRHADTVDYDDTPALVSIRIRAVALPGAIYRYEFEIENPASGPTAGLTQQKEMRAFQNAIGSSQYPMTLTDPWGTDHTVAPIKPYPMEGTTKHTIEQWDSQFVLHFRETASLPVYVGGD